MKTDQKRSAKKVALAAIAVIGIAITLMIAAGAMHGNDNKGFGGKGFAKMNPAINACMNDSAAKCKADTLNTTEMRECVNKAMADCKLDLNLTGNSNGARPDMRNHMIGKRGNFSPDMNFSAGDVRPCMFERMNAPGMLPPMGCNACMNESAAKCKADTLNTTEMRDCVEKAMESCRADLNLTINTSCARPDMRNHMIGKSGNFSPDMNFSAGDVRPCMFGRMNAPGMVPPMGCNACMNESAAKCKADTLNTTEMRECVNKAMADCKADLNLTVNVNGARPAAPYIRGHMMTDKGNFSAGYAPPSMFGGMNGPGGRHR